MVINGTWNLYMDALKMSIFPPMIINKDNVASFSSLKPIPGAMWLGRNNVTNVASPVNLSPKGVETFNNTHQVAAGAIQSLFGQSDTSIAATTNPQLGKTPQALQMQAARENTRDNADKFYMEEFIRRTVKKMINLMTKKQSAAVSFRMFPEEIDLIAKDYPQIKDMYNEKSGQLTVKKGKDSSLYDYEIVTGSTFATDAQTQQQNLEALMQLYFKSFVPPFGNLLDNKLKEDNYKLDFGQLFKGIVANSGIDSWEKILVDMSMQEQADNMLTQHAQHFQGVLKDAQSQSLSNVPPMPQAQQPQENMPHGPINFKGTLAEQVRMNYKDLPPDIQRQAESDAGFQPSQFVQPVMPTVPLSDPHLEGWSQQPQMPPGVPQGMPGMPPQMQGPQPPQGPQPMQQPQPLMPHRRGGF